MCNAGLSRTDFFEQAQQTISANSPLAKIREGMSKGEMIYLLRPPTDIDKHYSVKAMASTH
jgi:hypothetical protein